MRRHLPRLLAPGSRSLSEKHKVAHWPLTIVWILTATAIHIIKMHGALVTADNTNADNTNRHATPYHAAFFSLHNQLKIL